jgi:peroxiredoxin
MIRRILIFLIGLIIIACAQMAVNSDNSVYFGGEIINPKEDIVVLYNEIGAAADTVSLDDNNRFLIKLDNVSTGLYSFWHGGEYQLVMIEPKDSIMLRLNTQDFDESLVFSGRGARKNNYLIKLFLQNDNENRKLVKYCQKPPVEFESFLNERHSKKIEELNAFIEKKPLSSFAQNILKASIDYNYYADKEIYPFAYFGNNKLVHNRDLPSEFYAHRDLVNYNASDMAKVFAYNRFLFAHIDNLAINHFYENHDYDSKFNRHELSYNKAKLDLVDSLITDEAIKNNLLKYKTRDFISHSLDNEEINEILDYYKTKSTNPKDIAYMERLATAIDELKPGNNFPDLRLVNINNQELSIKELVQKPTLIYFWSSNNKKHYRNSHYRVRELKKKFPDVEFISININENPDEFWKETLYKYKFSLENEYKFKDPQAAKETLALNFVYKVMVVDKDGHILHPNVNIFSKNFEDAFEILLQKKSTFPMEKRSNSQITSVN